MVGLARESLEDSNGVDSCNLLLAIWDSYAVRPIAAKIWRS